MRGEQITHLKTTEYVSENKLNLSPGYVICDVPNLFLITKVIRETLKRLIKYKQY